MSHTSFPVADLAHLVGTWRAPVIIDVRSSDAFAADPRLIPGSLRRDSRATADCSDAFRGLTVVVTCKDGLDASQAVAAALRHENIDAKHLAGGFDAWLASGNLSIRGGVIPPTDAGGRTVWVTRERPKIDRIACPWLIRRFIDPEAIFLFVTAAEVPAVADRLNAVPFDIEGVFWSHRGETCTFDTMLTEFGLKSPPLDRLAAIVRGADTARLDLVPQAAGFLAVSLGLSQLFDDDLAQLEAGMTLYDATYLWCRDANEETHNWPCKAGPTRTS
ncbi:MAG: chromate resistance protein ChrB domain-containing protein [Hyphomicrobium sp.]